VENRETWNLIRGAPEDKTYEAGYELRGVLSESWGSYPSSGSGGHIENFEALRG